MVGRVMLKIMVVTGELMSGFSGVQLFSVSGRDQIHNTQYNIFYRSVYTVCVCFSLVNTIYRILYINIYNLRQRHPLIFNIISPAGF
jgi:hypothetical protein